MAVQAKPHFRHIFFCQLLTLLDTGVALFALKFLRNMFLMVKFERPFVIGR